MTMRCDRWRDPIADVSAGGPVTAELEAHLGTCPACRQALLDEQSLHAQIDGELQAMLSLSPSPELLPRVREQVARRGMPWTLLLLPAAAALALLVFAPGALRPGADPTPAVRLVEARPAPLAPAAAPATVRSDAPRPPAKLVAAAGRQPDARVPVRRDPLELVDAAIGPIPDVEPVRPAALVIAPLDALPPIEPRPLVTVGLDFEGDDR